MKMYKKIFALALTVVMIFALGTTAMAATITITGDETGNTYCGYKLLNLTTSGTGTDLELKYSYTVNTKYESYIRDALNLQTGDIVAALGVLTGEQTRAFADTVYLAILDAGLLPDATTTTNSFTGVDQGYWLIAEVPPAQGVENAIGSLVMLDTAGKNNLEIAPKKTIPTVEKEVQENSTDMWGETADYTIGDSVPFRLSATVPSQAGSYDLGYTFIFHDTLSDGLTFNAITSVKVGGVDYATTNYAVSPVVGGYFTVTVTGLKDHAGEAVVIEYTATLNTEASIYTDSNPNEVYLEYSNNPYGEGTGETTEVDVDVYTYSFDIFKYTEVEESEDYPDGQMPLADAEFELYTDEGFTENVKFSLVGNVYTVDPAGTTTIIVSDADGNARIEGLDKGTYYLKETKAPDGYNLIEEPFEVVIADVNGEVLSTLTGLVIEVLNNSGGELPGTGGIGTTIFYIVGGALVCFAVVMLVLKKRKSEASDN